MPHLELNQIIKILKEQHPDIDDKHFDTICKTPFRYIKSQMELPTMPIIMIKGFGKFRVMSSNIKDKISRLHRMFVNKGNTWLSEEDYLSRKALLEERYKLLLTEEMEENAADMRSAKNRREAVPQILNIIDDTIDNNETTTS